MVNNRGGLDTRYLALLIIAFVVLVVVVIFIVGIKHVFGDDEFPLFNKTQVDDDFSVQEGIPVLEKANVFVPGVGYPGRYPSVRIHYDEGYDDFFTFRFNSFLDRVQVMININENSEVNNYWLINPFLFDAFSSDDLYDYECEDVLYIMSSVNEDVMLDRIVSVHNKDDNNYLEFTRIGDENLITSDYNMEAVIKKDKKVSKQELLGVWTYRFPYLFDHRLVINSPLSEGSIKKFVDAGVLSFVGDGVHNGFELVNVYKHKSGVYVYTSSTPGPDDLVKFFADADKKRFSTGDLFLIKVGDVIDVNHLVSVGYLKVYDDSRDDIALYVDNSAFRVVIDKKSGEVSRIDVSGMNPRNELYLTPKADSSVILEGDIFVGKRVDVQGLIDQGFLFPDSDAPSVYVERDYHPTYSRPCSIYSTNVKGVNYQIYFDQYVVYLFGSPAHSVLDIVNSENYASQKTLVLE